MAVERDAAEPLRVQLERQLREPAIRRGVAAVADLLGGTVPPPG